MDQSLLVAIVAGAGGMLGWGLADFFAKKTIDEIGDVTSLVLAHLVGAAVFIGLIILHKPLLGTRPVLPDSIADWSAVAGYGLLQAIVYLLVYRGFGEGQLALLNPLFASFSGLAALASVLFFGEALTDHLAAALITLFAGVILLNLDPAALRERRLALVRVPGFAEIAIATLLAAAWTIGWSRFVRGHDGLTLVGLMYLAMAVALVIYSQVAKVRLRVPRAAVWVHLALIGLTEVAAYLAISWGYANTRHTSVVALLSGAFSLPTIVLARVILQERTTALQALASLMIVAGIVILST